MCGDGKKCGGCGVMLVVKVLLIVGGLNWGLVGAGMLMGKSIEAWNAVHMLLGAWPMVEGIVYLLVGIAALMKIFGCKCKKCKEACMACVSENVAKPM